MLLVLIPIVWVALLVLFAAICRVAAAGDGRRARSIGGDAISIGARLTLSPLSEHRRAQSPRGQRSRPGSLARSRSRRPAHGVR